MDTATVIGMVVGLGLVLASILIGGSSIMSFINPPGILIVGGGTFAATMAAQKMGQFLGSAKVGMKAFFNKSPRIDETIKTLAELAVKVRSEGLLALDNHPIEDEYLAKGIRLAVDGIPPEEVKATLAASLVALKQRHKTGRKTFLFMASTAPAMGMVGTLIGLVQMLQVMSDPSAIGPAMAVALLTTLYGAVLAFMIFKPIAEKLEVRSAEETANLLVILDGLDLVLKGENARIVQEKLEGVLPPKERKSAKDAA